MAVLNPILEIHVTASPHGTKSDPEIVVVGASQKKEVFFIESVCVCVSMCFSNDFGHKSKVVSTCRKSSLQPGHCICSMEQLDCHLPNFAFIASINHSIACNPGTAC